jgi:hypothetical protein
LESGQTLIAPEVVHMEFRYYDGQQITDVWDMAEEDSLPLAIEIRIWLISHEEIAATKGSSYELTSLMASAREYRQTVRIPMSSVSGSEFGGASSGSQQQSSNSNGQQSSL